MALKIDLEKAFDKLEWGFIKHILSFFNFLSDWIELIISCISTSSLSFLVNGECLIYFLPSRGIRQGDPLSPYTSFFAWNTLPNSSFVRSTRTHGQELELRETAQPFLIFAKATKRNYLTIKNTFNKFYFLSGQKINFSKSRIYFLPLPPRIILLLPKVNSI